MNSDKQKRIPAHQSRSIHLFILVLSAIAITLNGDKVATSSEKGQNIRIFSVDTGDMIQEVRRGNEYAMIYSLSFSKGGNWLSCSSDSNTIHIFYCQPCHEEVAVNIFSCRSGTILWLKQDTKIQNRYFIV
jgi:WD40 repeat protein